MIRHGFDFQPTPARGDDGKIRAVLKIFGDPTASYRDYQAVAQAAKGGA